MKDWKGNKNSIFKCLGASNHTEKEREKNDFYATSPVALEKLMNESNGYQLPSVVYEPACGNGCLSEVLAKSGRKVYSYDIVDRGYGDGVRDFLNTKCLPDDCKCILTNPPYSMAMEFVLHSLKLLPENGICAMFLKTTFLEGKRRFDKLFSVNPPRYIFQFVQRVLCAKNGDFDGMVRGGGGSAVSYAWFIWEKGYGGDPVVKWL